MASYDQHNQNANYINEDKLRIHLIEAKGLVRKAEAKVKLGFKLGQYNFAAYASEALSHIERAINLAKNTAMQGGDEFIAHNKDIYKKINSGIDKVCSGIELGVTRFFKQATGFLRKRTKQAVGKEDLIARVASVRKANHVIENTIDRLPDTVILGPPDTVTSTDTRIKR